MERIAGVTLNRTTGGHTANISVDHGVLRSAGAVRGQGMTVWPDETLLLQIGGVAEARRLVVTGAWSFGSREGEVCQ